MPFRQIFMIVAFLLADVAGAQPAPTPQPVKPNLEFPTAATYEKEIGEAGVMMEGEHVIVFAPKRLEQRAKLIGKYVSEAYAELHRVTGYDTKYKIVVYHFPPGNPNARGSTSECVIRYGYDNLDFAKSREWAQYQVPHVSGYIEEMAHNFVDAAHVNFGWEMVGWTLGVNATKKVANNPIFEKSVAETRAGQMLTLRRYKAAWFTLPPDIPSNQADRIHAAILWHCEQSYGPNFWPDFFTEVRKEKKAFDDAVSLSDGNAIRNARYRLSIACFERLPGLGFKRLLEENGVSTNVAVQSLNPDSYGWDRKLMEPVPQRQPAVAAAAATPADTLAALAPPQIDALSPLCRAAYHGDGYRQIVEGGAGVNDVCGNRRTPLHFAALAGHQSACEYLLQHGSDPAAKDGDGRTPAELAKMAGHEGVEKFLREKIR
ncbi:hypothetical protein BH09SUM1_BH09SUM1_20740 [soil metagenome]